MANTARRTHEGQLKPLAERLSKDDQLKRQQKIAARRTVAEQMGMGLYNVATNVVAFHKRQRVWNYGLLALVVVLLALLGYHVHIHPGV